MRRAAKTDSNHKEIMKIFRDLGCTVFSTHMVGKGFPDMVVGYRCANYLVEVKDGSLAPSRRKLTPDEQEFVDGWNGTVSIVETIQDAINLVTGAGND